MSRDIYIYIYAMWPPEPLHKIQGSIQHNQFKIYIYHIAPRPWMGDLTKTMTKETKEAIIFRQEFFRKTMVTKTVSKTDRNKIHVCDSQYFICLNVIICKPTTPWL